jgi:hypothetical protein
MRLDPAWLDSLATVESAASERLAVSGIVVGAPSGRLRLLMTDVCVDFATQDVLALDGLEMSGLGVEGRESATQVDVLIREGSPVLAIQDAAALYVGEAWGQATFAYFVRRESRPGEASQAFRERERAYLRRWRLVDDG